MNKTKHHLLLVMLVLASLAIPTLIVFAKELGSLTISGPGIKGEITLNDPKYMMSLQESGFFDQAVLTKAPNGLNSDAGYTLTTTLNLDGKVVPFAKLVYYATHEGQPGYVHYIARYQGNALQAVDEWDVLSRDADQAFRDLMTANNITLQSALAAAPIKAESPAQPVTAPVASRISTRSPYLILATGILIILLVGAGLTVRRRVGNTTN